MSVDGVHLVLVGLMGSGKTTCGRLAAERLGREFVDTDAVIEAADGRTVREIWLADGEPAFRRLERQVVLDALAAETPAVIAAAGGVVLDADNRRALAEAPALVAWLFADPAALVDRVTGGGHRPLLDDDPAATLAAMADSRAALYAEVADVTIDVSEQHVDDVVDELLHVLATFGDLPPDEVDATAGVADGEHDPSDDLDDLDHGDDLDNLGDADPRPGDTDVGTAEPRERFNPRVGEL